MLCDKCERMNGGTCDEGAMVSRGYCLYFHSKPDASNPHDHTLTTDGSGLMLGSPEMEAYERLHAAAEELLAACKKGYNATRLLIDPPLGPRDPRTCPGRVVMKTMREASVMLEAAIAKAEGK
jgi:hypothetical protein